MEWNGVFTIAMNTATICSCRSDEPQGERLEGAWLHRAQAASRWLRRYRGVALEIPT